MALEWQDTCRLLSAHYICEEIPMSTSAVSSSSLNQQLQTYFQGRQSDQHQLGQALQSGDVSEAETDFNNITALGQNGPFPPGNRTRTASASRISLPSAKPCRAGTWRALNRLLVNCKAHSAIRRQSRVLAADRVGVPPVGPKLCSISAPPQATPPLRSRSRSTSVTHPAAASSSRSALAVRAPAIQSKLR